MTMLSAYFRVLNRPDLTVKELQDRIFEIREKVYEIDELPAFDGSVGAIERTFRIELHISDVADLKEIMEKWVDAEFILAW